MFICNNFHVIPKMLYPRTARHFDRPLPESSARFCRQTSQAGSNRRVSVVNLNQSNSLWIPGQQLFGDMIPRPQREARIHEIELVCQKEKFERFRSLVKASMEMNIAGTTRKRLTVKKHRGHSQEPFAHGYEVIPAFHDDSCGGDDNLVTKVLERKRLTVVLPTGDEHATDTAEKKELVLESYCKYVYEVKDQDSSEEAEATEIANLGRYKTVSKDQDGSQMLSDSEDQCPPP
jgi:hypothetical protein